MAFHQYNSTKYNTSQYNADAAFLILKTSEGVASTDARVDSPLKVLLEALTSTDARVVAQIRALPEFVFLTDVLMKSILNKGFSESVRTNDWIEIERKSLGNGNGWS